MLILILFLIHLKVIINLLKKQLKKKIYLKKNTIKIN